MSDYPPTVVEAIKRDAVERYPNESCGLVLRRADGELVYRATPNTAADPRTSFHIDDRLVLAVQPSLIAIVHSHPDGPDCPSRKDMEQQVAFDLPFGIVSTNGVGCLEPFFWGGDTPLQPLIGRGFRHGVTDCYALIRDYYRETLGMILKEYPRDWSWWSAERGSQTLYEDNFADCGFHRISDSEVREHDVFLARIHCKTPNHAGVYVGKTQILHHLTSTLPVDASRLSRREPLGVWTKFICGYWVRHEELARA